MSTKKKFINLGILLIIVIGLFIVINAGPTSNNENNESAPIKINNLSPGQIIQSPLIIEGEARGYWFFEASFPVKLYDENNQLIGATIAQVTPAGENWMTDNFVPFRAELNFNYTTSTKGILVLEKDNPSGLPENYAELRVPVKFLSSSEKIKIKIFFNNNKLDPAVSCNKVFPVEREIIKTPAIARAALTELLAGPTLGEEKDGFVKIIGSDVKIQSLTIENGVAKVDFNEQLEAGSGGSCRAAAIIAQINATLKQFLSVKTVVISINGRSDDILQP
ncbi:MAG: GerMN domain-containing protein [Patescibacteria group bacterium]